LGCLWKLCPPAGLRFTSRTTRFFAFEAAGLLNQASEPHSTCSRLTSVELMNFPLIFFSLHSVRSASQPMGIGRRPQSDESAERRLATRIRSLQTGASILRLLRGRYLGENRLAVIACGECFQSRLGSGPAVQCVFFSSGLESRSTNTWSGP